MAWEFFPLSLLHVHLISVMPVCWLIALEHIGGVIVLQESRFNINNLLRCLRNYSLAGLFDDLVSSFLFTVKNLSNNISAWVYQLLSIFTVGLPCLHTKFLRQYSRHTYLPHIFKSISIESVTRLIVLLFLFYYLLCSLLRSTYYPPQKAPQQTHYDTSRIPTTVRRFPV